ncbi:hypothetical protein ACH4E7_38090 [Kitasatospora sp. NPDC018058]|uniref:hypothetical protein n=1 Tax=Kitasatospora sp. NPDC018058 TaxID=3364025 RepID=UPI0037C136AF
MDEVEEVMGRLADGASPHTMRENRALVAWALGDNPWHRSPTRTWWSDTPPDEAQLAGEERAALRRAHAPRRDTQERDFTVGVARALARVLGHTDDWP